MLTKFESFFNHKIAELKHSKFVWRKIYQQFFKGVILTTGRIVVSLISKPRCIAKLIIRIERKRVIYVHVTHIQRTRYKCCCLYICIEFSLSLCKCIYISPFRTTVTLSQKIIFTKKDTVRMRKNSLQDSVLKSFKM